MYVYYIDPSATLYKCMIGNEKNTIILDNYINGKYTLIINLQWKYNLLNKLVVIKWRATLVSISLLVRMNNNNTNVHVLGILSK